MELINGKQRRQKGKSKYNSAGPAEDCSSLASRSLRVNPCHPQNYIWLIDMEEKMDTKAKIKEVLVNLLKVKADELKDELSLQDSISVDSTEMVESVIALEKAFGIKLSPKEITKYSSINDIEKVILSK